MKRKHITILGSTGTIGKNSLEIIKDYSKEIEIEALTAENNYSLLAEQAINYRAKKVVIGNENYYFPLKELLEKNSIEVYSGKDALVNVASEKVDLLINGIVGFSGLLPTLSAIRSSQTIALANKESLVCAGDFLMKEVKKNQARIVPLDSEHNAIFQLIQDEDKNNEIEKITITASGGPFWNLPKKNFKHIKVKDALKHPNWTMGKKITVDSATMVNKGFEIIEAFHLFNFPKDNINAIIHPESIMHALIYYSDGSVKASLSNPDMKVPISFSIGEILNKRVKSKVANLDLNKVGNLSFFEPNYKKFPCFKLAISCLDEMGMLPCILNAANEMAVSAFLQEKISFLDIFKVCEKTLNSFQNSEVNSLEDILECDMLARQKSQHIINLTS